MLSDPTLFRNSHDTSRPKDLKSKRVAASSVVEANPLPQITPMTLEREVAIRNLLKSGLPKGEVKVTPHVGYRRTNFNAYLLKQQLGI